MVNVEKHRRKAIENDVYSFINFINGSSRRNIYKKSKDLDNRVKPKLASGMNMNHFRPQLKKEVELKQELF